MDVCLGLINEMISEECLTEFHTKKNQHYYFDDLPNKVDGHPPISTHLEWVKQNFSWPLCFCFELRRNLPLLKKSINHFPFWNGNWIQPLRPNLSKNNGIAQVLMTFNLLKIKLDCWMVTTKPIFLPFCAYHDKNKIKSVLLLWGTCFKWALLVIQKN